MDLPVGLEEGEAQLRKLAVVLFLSDSKTQLGGLEQELTSRTG